MANETTRSWDRDGALFTLRGDGGTILLQHRTDDAPAYAGKWGFFGGRVDPGETVEAGCRREAREELQLELPPVLKRLGPFFVTKPDGIVRFHLFYAPLTLTMAELRHRQREGQGLGLFALDELNKLDTIAHDEVFFAALRRQAARIQLA